MTAIFTPPPVIIEPFAAQGDLVPIPQQGGADTDFVSQDSGFPPRMSLPPSNPECVFVPREGTNGAFNLYSKFSLWNSVGGTYTFQQEIADAGGYNKGAMLFYDAAKVWLYSTKDNNVDNFLSNPSFIGTSWVYGPAPIESPDFIGIPKVPTPSPGDISKQIANTEFVHNAFSKYSYITFNTSASAVINTNYDPSKDGYELFSFTNVPIVSGFNNLSIVSNNLYYALAALMIDQSKGSFNIRVFNSATHDLIGYTATAQIDILNCVTRGGGITPRIVPSITIPITVNIAPLDPSITNIDLYFGFMNNAGIGMPASPDGIIGASSPVTGYVSNNILMIYSL